MVLKFLQTVLQELVSNLGQPQPQLSTSNASSQDVQASTTQKLLRCVHFKWLHSIIYTLQHVYVPPYICLFRIEVSSVQMFPPFKCPLSVDVSSVQMSPPCRYALRVNIPSVQMSLPCRCPLHVYVHSPCVLYTPQCILHNVYTPLCVPHIHSTMYMSSLYICLLSAYVPFHVYVYAPSVCPLIYYVLYLLCTVTQVLYSVTVQ